MFYIIKISIECVYILNLIKTVSVINYLFKSEKRNVYTFKFILVEDDLPFFNSFTEIWNEAAQVER